MVVPHWARQGDAADFARLADDPDEGPRLRRAIEEVLDGATAGPQIRDRPLRAKPEPGRPRPRGHRPAGGDDAPGRRAGDRAARRCRGDQLRHERGRRAARHGAGLRRDRLRRLGPRPRRRRPSPPPLLRHLPPQDRRYALDDGVITLEQAIRAGSGLPAEILRLPDRGVLRPGAFADVVVFDPATFRDAATFDDPTQYAAGVQYLFVNGVAAIAEGKHQEKLAGRALRLAKDGPPDLILKVGRIWTGDPDRPWAEALAARGGVIVAVGPADEVLTSRGPTTRLVDRPGAFAMPGLIDAHGHLSDAGRGLEEVDLRGVASLEEVARRVKARADATPGDGWITGRNWDQSLWPGGAFPTAAVLDAVAPDRPVWLRRVDGHAGWANSEAMRRAAVTAETQAPADGQILRDPDGRPTGVFIDGAMGLVGRVVPPADADAIARHILAAQRLALEAGLTAVHDAGVSAAEADVYRRLDRAGQAEAPRLRHGHAPRRRRGGLRQPAPGPRRRPLPAAGDQALHRRRDGLARRPAVRALRRRPGEHGPPAHRPRASSRPPPPRPSGAAGRSAPTPSATAATPWSSTPTPPPSRRSPRRRTRGSASSTPRWCRKADVAAVPGAGDHRLDAALARQRRHALGRRPARAGPRRRGLRLAMVPRRGRAPGLRQRLPGRGGQPVLGDLRRPDPPGRAGPSPRRLAPGPAA